MDKKAKKTECSSLKSWFCKFNIFGLALLAFGISILFFLPDYMHKQLMTNLQIVPDTQTYAGWKKPSVPLYMDVYIFNWTNPQDITNHSTKPILVQLGPYRFREYRDKHNISFHDNNNTVSYKKSSHYYFEEEASNGTLEDVVSVMNMLAVGAASHAQYWSTWKQLGISTSLTGFGQKISVVKSVREMLFEGYHDSLLTLGSLFGPEASKFDTIGFLVKQNATDVLTEKYNIHTGVDDISQLGNIKNYKDLDEFPFYSGECKKLKGSPGEFYPPGRSKEDLLYLFTPEMCRSFPFEYKEDVTIHGIKGNRYYLNERAIDNGTLYPENACYMSDDELPSGVMNISICNYNQPAFISYPHFYLADPSYLDAVEGLSPKRELHESYRTLEPKTSVTLETVARFQTNFLLRPFNSISLYKNIKRTMMPLFFVEVKFRMSEEHARELYYGLMIVDKIGYFGVILIILGVLFIAWRRCKRAERKRDVKIDPKEMTSLVK